MKTEGIMKQDDGIMMSPGMMPPQRMSALHRPRGKMRGSHPKPPTVEIPLEEAAKRVSYFFLVSMKVVGSCMSSWAQVLC